MAPPLARANPRDTQIHSAAGPEAFATQPLSLCFGPAFGVNLTPVAPGARLTVACLGPVAAAFTDGESLLPRSDWHTHAANPAVHRDGVPAFPTNSPPGVGSTASRNSGSSRP